MSIINIAPTRVFRTSGNVTYYDQGNVAIGRTSPSFALDISGELNVDNKIEENGIPLIPKGLIIMWYGTIASIPAGWTVCDGLNGTPDLRNSYIICGNSDTQNSVMTNITGDDTQRGGTTDCLLINHSHTLTLDSSGAHRHVYSENTVFGGLKMSAQGASSQYSTSNTSSAGAHSHTYTTDSTGIPAKNANLPPFRAVVFIMKL